MSYDSSFLKNTLELLETDPEVKSFIYQQILDFNNYVTPETLVMVVARDPKAPIEQLNEDDEVEMLTQYELEEQEGQQIDYKYRIAIVLKDGESSIEAEAFHNDLFDAIKAAKNNLIDKLVRIQEEVESPQDRMNAIKEASDNKQVH